MRPAPVEDVDAIDAAFACDFFSKAFRNPAEFHVVFVGNVDVEARIRREVPTAVTIPSKNFFDVFSATAHPQTSSAA